MVFCIEFNKNVKYWSRRYREYGEKESYVCINVREIIRETRISMSMLIENCPNIF